MDKIKVWLDDIRDPQNSFIQREYGATPDMVWIKNPEEVKQLLSKGKVEFISFDNDLGPSYIEGRELAVWIENRAFFGLIDSIKWSVHTDNPSAKRDIIVAMNNANRHWEILGM